MYTTRLLEIVDDVMPRRHQIILGVIVAGLTLFSVVNAVERRVTSAAVQPPAPIVIVATPTLPVTCSQDLVEGAAPLIVRSAFTAVPTVAPTAAATIAPAVVQVEPTPQLEVGQAAAAPEPTARGVHERASGKSAPPKKR